MKKQRQDDDYDFSNLTEKTKNKLFLNRDLPKGTVVTSRLNLTGGYVHNKNTDEKILVQSIHLGETAKGEIIGYDYFVNLSNVHFYINQFSRRDIVIQKESKHPMAGVVGNITQENMELTNEIVGFNPKKYHLFVNYDNIYAVKGAEYATIYGNKVYCKNIEYFSIFDAPLPIDNLNTEVLFFDYKINHNL
jgi:hypothetical protein